MYRATFAMWLGQKTEQMTAMRTVMNLNHPWEVASISKLQHNNQLVVLDERREVPDHIWMIEMFQQINLLDAILPRLGIHHLKYLAQYISHGLQLTHTTTEQLC